MNQKDCDFGDECERLFLTKFGKKYNKTDRFNEVDFIHKKKDIRCELKGRRYTFGHCPDWQISKSKMDKGKQLYDKGIDFFIYNMFYDGLYFWKYHPDKIKNDINIRWGGRVDRNKDEQKPDYHYIKSECMKKSKYQVNAPRQKELFDECIF